MKESCAFQLRPDVGGCSTIIIGKAVSATGRYLLAHSEDDYDCLVEVHKVPRIRHKAGETLSFPDGSAVVPEVEEAYAYQWSEFRGEEGISFADCFVNEWGLAVVSNNCNPCKISETEEQRGGLAYALRRLIAERAKSAREAVELAAKLVEEYGYAACRSYHFVDKDEAWAFQVPVGHNYVARRIPEDAVYFIPNNFTIHQIDFSDTEHKNFYFSADLVDFARRNGWYVPANEGDFSDFDFARAYQKLQDDGEYDREDNAMRTRNAWPFLLGYQPEEWRPFCVKADKTYTVADLKALLRYHYDGTPDDPCAAGHDSPHYHPLPNPICNAMTAESSVIEFGPVPALTVIWRTVPKACITPFVPWYFGATRVPRGYEWQAPTTAQRTHFAVPAEEMRIDPNKAIWAFKILHYITEFDYAGTHERVHRSADKLEKAWEAEQPQLLACYDLLIKDHPAEAAELLTSYTETKARQAWEWALDMIQELGERKIKENNGTLEI